MNNSLNPPQIDRKRRGDVPRLPAGDQRLLVLLSIGLLLLTISLTGRATSRNSRISTAGSLRWLAGSTITDGVYRIDPLQLSPAAEDDLRALYHDFELIPPADLTNSSSVFGRPQDRLTGLLLENRQPPVTVAPPAAFFSFMFQPIPINEAGRELLTTVPGIGPRLADAILDLRTKKNRFSRPEELLDVPGIGPVRLQHFARYFTFQQTGT